MFVGSGPVSPRARDARLPGQDEHDAFAAMFDEHAAHLFDYCRRLTGAEAEAANAAEIALIAARSLPEDPGRLRAMLFALARQEIVSRNQLPDAEAGILALVHRHGILPEDLPAILGVSAGQAGALLTAGSAETGLAAEPLAPMPPSVWHRAAVALSGDAPTDPHGFPALTGHRPVPPAAARSGPPASSLATARRRLMIAAIVLAAAGTAAAGFVYLGGTSPGKADPYGRPQKTDIRTADSVAPSPAVASSSPAGRSRRHSHRASHHPADGIQPVLPPVAGQKSHPTPVGTLTPGPRRPSHAPKPSPSKSGHPSPSASSSPPPSPPPSPSATPAA